MDQQHQPDAPHRTADTQMRCCCRLQIRTFGKRIGWDSCGGITSGSDEPICIHCVSAGHPAMDIFDPTIKN